MSYALTRIHVTGAGLQFSAGPMRFDAVADFGLIDNEAQAFVRGFAEEVFRKSVKPGWKVSVPELWRRRDPRVRWRDMNGLRYVALTRPDGRVLVLEFRSLPLPEGVVAELTKYAAGFQEKDNGDRQQRDESVSAEEGSADSGGRGVVGQPQREGGAGQRGTGDGKQELPRRQASRTERHVERKLRRVEEDDGVEFTPEEIEALAANLEAIRRKELQAKAR